METLSENRLFSLLRSVRSLLGFLDAAFANLDLGFGNFFVRRFAVISWKQLFQVSNVLLSVPINRYVGSLADWHVLVSSKA